MRWSWIWGLGADPIMGVLMGTGDDVEIRREPRWGWQQRREPWVCTSRNAEGCWPALEAGRGRDGCKTPGSIREPGLLPAVPDFCSQLGGNRFLVFLSRSVYTDSLN